MPAPITIESLESRQLASISLNANLIVNPGAEAGPGTIDASTTPVIPGWRTQGLFSVVKYDSPGFLKTSDVTNFVPGRNLFSGGRIGLPGNGVKLWPSASQTIDLSSLATDIDAGRIDYGFSSFLGGFGKEEDTMNVQLDFSGANGNFISTFSMNGPTAAERGYASGLVRRAVGGIVEAGTRFITVTLSATRISGYVADGYADNVYLEAESTMKTAAATGTVFNDLNGNGKQDKNETAGPAGVTVYTAVNSFGDPDLTKPFALTDANGNYTLNNVKPGKLYLQTMAPAGYRQTNTLSIVPTAVTGLTTQVPQALGFSQTALVSGTAVRDGSSSGIAGVTVFLDTNGNGQLDAGETSTRTHLNGTFNLVAPQGQYDLRIKKTSSFKQSAPSKNRPFQVSVASGAVSAGNIFSLVPLR